MQKSFTQIAAERKDGKIQNDTCLDKITLEINSEITPPASYIEIEKEETEVCSPGTKVFQKTISDTVEMDDDITIQAGEIQSTEAVC